jgi:hypothetical protein
MGGRDPEIMPFGAMAGLHYFPAIWGHAWLFQICERVNDGIRTRDP